MTKRLTSLLAASVITIAACGGDDAPVVGSDADNRDDTSQRVELAITSCDPNSVNFTPGVENAYMPLPVGRRLRLEGDDDGEAVVLEIDVLDRTKTVAGVHTQVVTETEFHDGEIYERTFNYFATAADGTLCYFGEDVTFYEDGEPVRTTGSWLANGQDNKPGIQMPAAPTLGQSFYQEFAPGVAEDRTSITATGLTQDWSGGRFDDVIELGDYNPLEGQTERDAEAKRYARGIGLVADGPIVLTGYRARLNELSGASCDPATQTFSLTIDHPYLPMPVGKRLVLEGEEDGEQIRLEIEVLDQTKLVAGVQTRVVTETETIDGELFERTFNYFAQAADGTVCYFGEDVAFFEEGIETSRQGSWLAGAAGARPGIAMPAVVRADDWFAQEVAPGIAEDRSLVEAIGQSLATPAGDLNDVIRLGDWNPLDGDSFLDAEPKFYARGLGLVGDNVLRLTTTSP
ncbi:MAG: hypothetical protein R3E87_22820 [Burkholderiaceae bacterium]